MSKPFYKEREEKIENEFKGRKGYVKDEIGGWIKIPRKKEEKEPIKDLDNLKPIDHGVIAYPHTPVYKMHRYFARRPWSVFNELIRHYSNPGSIVLDPFCGGGVTIVEGLRLRRKVIGVDLMPNAIFNTRMEVIDVDLEKLKNSFEVIRKKVKEEIEKFYLTQCPKCKHQTSAIWFELSYVHECPHCLNEVQLNKAKRIRGGEFQCNYCQKIFKVTESQRKGEIPIRVKLECQNCGFKGEKLADDFDVEKFNWFNKNFERIVKEKNLWYPKDQIYPGYNTTQLLKRGFKYFFEVFTRRNLLALSMILNEIRKIEDKKIRELMELCFTARLHECSKLAHIKNSTVVKPGHHFWPADFPAEANVWRQFANAWKILIKGKEYSQQEIGNFYKEAKKFEDLVFKNATCLLITGSSTKLPLPDESVDVIITDPPYGGNVNYSEMCDFWAIWIRDTLGLKEGEFIEREEEAIINKYQKYKGKPKGISEYRELMYRVFKECYRVLKPNRWLVMTFHNRNFQVWNAIHLAAHDAGFVLPEEDGMIYQPPIQAYTTTLHQKRGGAMLGDFILSFKKAKELPKKKLIEYVDIGKRIQELAAETIQYHGGATLSQIYMRLIPFLVNKRKLDEIKEEDLPKYLNEKFEERNGKWYFKEKLDPDIEEYLKNYNKEHYDEETALLDFVPVEARLETTIRWLLIKKGPEGAKMDEILNAVYTRLINSNAADYGEISRVLNRIAVQKPEDKRFWILKEDLRKQLLLEEFLKPSEEEKLTEKEKKTREMSEHDLMILRLLDLGEFKGYGCHVGLREQNMMLEFKKRSEPMINNVQYGMDKRGFDIVRQIDVLWLKGNQIVKAFEVEKSTTIDSGINRFRNLFAVQPNSKIDAYIVVPDEREEEAIKKLNSPANRKEGLHERIKIIKFSDLKIKRPIEELEIEL